MVDDKSGHRSVGEVQWWGRCASFQRGRAGVGVGSGNGQTQYDVGVYVMAYQGVRVSGCQGVRVVVSLLPYAISRAVQISTSTLDPALET